MFYIYLLCSALVTVICFQIYDFFLSFSVVCWNYQFSDMMHNPIFLWNMWLFIRCLYWTSFPLYDQHGKIISREELEKILEKQKTEQVEVRKYCNKYEIHNNDSEDMEWMNYFSNRWLACWKLFNFLRNLLSSFAWFTTSGVRKWNADIIYGFEHWLTFVSFYDSVSSIRLTYNWKSGCKQKL